MRHDGADAVLPRPRATRIRRPRLVDAVASVLVCALGSVPAGALSQQAPAPRTYPAYDLSRELAVVGAGAALEVGIRLISVDVGVVPAQGRPRGDIGWSVDREAIGTPSLDAGSASNWTRDGATLLPFALSWLSSPGARWSATARRTIVYTEAMFITHGLTYLGKDAINRPRPFVYLPVSERPADEAYDVATKHAFSSMPSGHASSAWTGAALAMTEHLLSRPDAGW